MLPSAHHFQEVRTTYSAPPGNGREDALFRPVPAHRREGAGSALQFAQLPSDGSAPLDREKRQAVPYQRLRRASRPKSVRCLGCEARSETPESTVPHALFINAAKLRGPGFSRGVSSTSRNPSATRSLSLRPRKAASALALR